MILVLKIAFLLNLIFFNGFVFAKSDICEIKIPNKLNLNQKQRDSLCEGIKSNENFSKELYSEVQKMNPNKKIEEYSDVEYSEYVNEFNRKKNDFLKILKSYSNSNPFNLEIIPMNKKSNCKHNLVLLGETHIKSKPAHDLGKKIVESFHFRGLEDSILESYESQEVKKGNDGGYGVILMPLFKSKSLYSSTIEDAYASSLYLNRENPLFLIKYKSNVPNLNFDGYAEDVDRYIATKNNSQLNFKKDFLKCNKEPINGIPMDLMDSFTDPGSFTYLFRELLDKTKNSSFYSFSIETGKLNTDKKFDCTNRKSHDCQFLTINLRNELMAKNINRIIENLPCGEPFLVIVGSDHLPGLVKLLSNKK